MANAITTLNPLSSPLAIADRELHSKSAGRYSDMRPILKMALAGIRFDPFPFLSMLKAEKRVTLGYQGSVKGIPGYG